MTNILNRLGSFSSIASLSIELIKYSKKRGERNHKILSLLKKYKVLELQKDFASVYAHALAEYGMDTQHPEIVKLLADKEIRNAFKSVLYDSDPAAFDSTLDAYLSKTDELKKDYKSIEDLRPEIDEFKTKFDYFTRQSADPFLLQSFNEMRQQMAVLIEDKEQKRFEYQTDLYLERLRDDFQKAFLDKNHYIDLNGEIRTPKRVEFNRESLKVPAKREKAYETVTYSPIDTFINQWLENDTRNCLIVIGEYGTGKTTLCKHIAHQMAVQHMGEDGKTAITDPKNRLPLLFPLRDFERTLVNFINSQFTNNGINDIDFARFKDRIAQDEFVIMLDGFDEMTQRIDSGEKAKNFNHIHTLIDSSPNSKIIVTCRQEYFQSDEEFNKVCKYADNPNYSVIHLNPFDDDQIRQYLDTHTDNPDFYWEQIRTIFDLKDLAKRVVLLDMIVEYLPKVIEQKKNGEKINASDLYRTCIDEELSRKSNDLDFILRDKYRLQILQKLSVWMTVNDVLSFDISVIVNELELKKFFKTDLDWEFEKYLNVFLTFTFLLREADNRYRISHRSFRDYLAAQVFVIEINSGKIQYFGKTQTSVEINTFIVEQQPNTKKLLKYVQNAKDLPEDKTWLGTNAASILLKIDRTAMKGKDLSRCRFVSVDFTKCDLSGTNFSECDLSGCWLDENILNAEYEGAKFIDALITILNQNISDLSFLIDFKNLQYLDVNSNQITDISQLKVLKNLQSLSVSYNQITDISQLKELKNLQYLFVSSNQITDISQLKELKNLTDLFVRSNQITDISHLRGLKNLQYLDVSYNKITDISHLKELKNLQTLNVSSNPIPDIQIEELKKSLPDTRIYFKD